MDRSDDQLDSLGLRMRASDRLTPIVSGDATPGGGGGSSGTKNVRRERLAGIGAILLEIGDALAGEERVVDQEIAGEALRRLLEDRDRPRRP